MPESTTKLPAPEGCAASPCSAVLERIEGMGVRKVMASTQYGMGFILVEQGPPDVCGGIVYRNDAMSHSERTEVADEVNRILGQNATVHPTGGGKLTPKKENE